MIKSLNKAFDMLEYLASSTERSVALSELSNAIGEKPTTCANILKTMTERGYVARTGSRGYKLGGEAYRLAGRESPEDERLIAASEEPMAVLAKELDVSTVLSVLRGGRKRVLSSRSGEGIIQVNKSHLADDRLLTTPTGLMLLTAEQESFIKKLAERNLPAFYTSTDDLLYRIAEAKKNDGIILSIHPEVSDAAVGIYKEGKLVAALGAYLPSYRFTDEVVLMDRLRRCALRIEQNLINN